MVLTNAERQRRYKERLKAKAAQAQLTPARIELLQKLRRRRDASLHQIELLEAGTIRLHQVTPDGQRDISAEAIASERAKIDEIDRMLAEYDPDGVSAG